MPGKKLFADTVMVARLTQTTISKEEELAVGVGITKADWSSSTEFATKSCTGSTDLFGKTGW